jgi:hypothetical protein
MIGSFYVINVWFAHCSFVEHAHRFAEHEKHHRFSLIARRTKSMRLLPSGFDFRKCPFGSSVAYYLGPLCSTGNPQMIQFIHCGGSELPKSVGTSRYRTTARYNRHANGDKAPPMEEQSSNSFGGHLPITPNEMTTTTNAATEFATA